MNKFFKAAVSAVSAAALVISGMPAGLGAPVLSTQAVDTNNDDWLHAEGSRLYDMNGNEITLNQGKTFVEIVRNQDASKVVISDDPSIDTYIIDGL